MVKKKYLVSYKKEKKRKGRKNNEWRDTVRQTDWRQTYTHTHNGLQIVAFL